MTTTEQDRVEYGVCVSDAPPLNDEQLAELDKIPGLSAVEREASTAALAEEMRLGTSPRKCFVDVRDKPLPTDTSQERA